MAVKQKSVMAGSDAPAKGDKPPETPLTRMLKRIRRTEEFPSISKYLVEINQKLSLCQEASDASDLANLILNDYALTNKLLKLVNSAYYGLVAGKVTTITRAVVVLGYERVRLATISLALLDHFQGKAHTADLKETLIASFWAGVVAREIAGSDGTIDPEEAFVCAMLSQLGKLVMVYYLPDEYQKVVDWVAAHGHSEAKAVKAACGVTYEALGTAVAGQWNFPDRICEGLQPLTPDDWRGRRKAPTQLRVVSGFVKALGQLIEQGELTGDDRKWQTLLDRYKDRVKLSRRKLQTLVLDSIDSVRRHAQALNFSIENSAFIQHLARGCETAQAQLPDVKAEASLLPESHSHQLTDGLAFKEESGDPAALSPKDVILAGIQEISEAMMADYDVNDIALMSLEILYRALAFHRALMFAREGDGRMMTIRFGYGHNSGELAHKVGFQVPSGRDLFNLSIASGKDLIVADAHDDKTVRLLPAWYRTHIDAPAFVFMPIKVQNVCIGAFYADRHQAGQPVSEEAHRYLSMLRNQLILAVKYRQGSK